MSSYQFHYRALQSVDVFEVVHALRLAQRVDVAPDDEFDEVVVRYRPCRNSQARRAGQYVIEAVSADELARALPYHFHLCLHLNPPKKISATNHLLLNRLLDIIL